MVNQKQCCYRRGARLGVHQLLLAAIFGLYLPVETVMARPAYLTAWQTKYPTSTLPTRIAAVNGSSCWICHHPPSLFNLGNCYRLDLRDLILNDDLTIEQALDATDGVDSDGDGVVNGVEILTPRAGEPGEVGYSPGLVGSQGTDPCLDPSTPITNQLETPPPPVPAISSVGLVVALGLLIGCGVLVQKRAVRPTIPSGSVVD